VLLADKVLYNHSEQSIEATGNVQLLQEKRSLKADRVIYCEQKNCVVADGNVRLQDENGDLAFSKHVELTGDLKRGFIQQVKVLTMDRERVAALSAHREDEKEDFYIASYTPFNQRLLN